MAWSLQAVKENLGMKPLVVNTKIGLKAEVQVVSLSSCPMASIVCCPVP